MVLTLTGPQRAAAVLAQMGTQRAAKVLKSMTESEVVALMATMAQLPTLDTDAVNEVLNDFVHNVTVLLSVSQGGIEAARKLLRERLGSARAEEVLMELMASSTVRPLSFLNRIDPVQVVNYLAEEHPQTIAVVLAHLPADHAAEVLRNMEEQMRVDVAQRIATMGHVSPEVVGEIAMVLERKLSMLLHSGGSAGFVVGGVAALVNILNNSNRTAEKEILAELEATDPELAEEVRNRLFVFDDVVKLDDRTLQRVLRNIVPKDLAVALKGVDEPVREKFMRNLSERAAQDLVEEIDILGPTRVSAVETAQASLVRTVREMEAAGEVVLLRGDDDLVV
ncbi:MAG: flagellar motor switch protein FliG [Acidimicrobiales bacterium]